jgi:cyclopropane fatty-acyl-phospholipid synthase-like methyltransferase
MTDVSYRDFYYPLNVFMHIITAEEGSVRDLHYGLFEAPEEPLNQAQARSTRLLFRRLPPAPARILDVGSGIGTTVRALTEAGYEVTGITPDEHQIAFIRSRETLPVIASTFEAFQSPLRFDLLLFQESSQYIESEALFAHATELSDRVLVFDEFALGPVEGGLRSLEDFLGAASRHGYRVAEELDVSARAAPTIDYFLERLPRHRERLMRDLGLESRQVDELIVSGRRYREAYRNGSYVYRLFDLRR